MLRFFITFIFSISLFVPAFANCDANETQIVLGLGTEDAKATQRLAADQLKVLVDRDLQGKACLQVVIDTDRFSDEKIFDSLRKGAAVFGLPRLSAIAASVREYQIFNLPFAFTDFQAVSKFQASKQMTQIQKKLSVLDVEPLGFVHGGFDQLVQSKQVLNSNNALGVRFDITKGGAFSDLVSGVKGISKRRNSKTIAQSLVDGDFDVAPVTWTDLNDPKLREALKSVVETNHAYQGFQLVANTAWLSSLDAGLRKEIEQTVQRGVNQIAFETVRRERAARNSLMRANKPVFALSRSQWLQWRSSASRVWNRFTTINGLELVAALQNANRLP